MYNYDPYSSQWKGADFARMTPSAWSGYPAASFSAAWHTYFSDDRADLNWEGRFAAVANKAALYNYYSTGDEVLSLANEAPAWDLTGVLHWNLTITVRQYAWHKQETHKGIGASGLSSTSWAGWGFGHPTRIEWSTDPTTGLRYPNVVQYYPDAAAAMSAWAQDASQFRDIPVFLKLPPGMFANSISNSLRREIIARGIPALSGPAGSRAINIPGTTGRNIDMNDTMRPNGWPRAGGHWLHGDWKDVAFFYNYGLYNDMAGKGGMR